MNAAQRNHYLMSNSMECLTDFVNPASVVGSIFYPNMVSPQSVEDVIGDIAQIGRVVNETAGAAGVVARMRADLALVPCG